MSHRRSLFPFPTIWVYSKNLSASSFFSRWSSMAVNRRLGFSGSDLDASADLRALCEKPMDWAKEQRRAIRSRRSHPSLRQQSFFSRHTEVILPVFELFLWALIDQFLSFFLGFDRSLCELNFFTRSCLLILIRLSFYAYICIYTSW